MGVMTNTTPLTLSDTTDPKFDPVLRDTVVVGVDYEVAGMVASRADPLEYVGQRPFIAGIDQTFHVFKYKKTPGRPSVFPFHQLKAISYCPSACGG